LNADTLCDGGTLSENDEVVALLREIRDLKKAHFERYQEFTAAALKRGEETAETQKRLAASTAQARENDQQYRLQMQQHLTETRASATRFRVILVVGIVLTLVLVQVLGYVVLAFLRR
jgi:DNA-binding transcriptional regulator/RsmH inhibitor MraZ